MKEIFFVPRQCEEAYKNLIKSLSILLLTSPVDIIVYPLKGGRWLACKLGRDLGIKVEPIKISFSRNEFSKEFNKYKDKRVLFVDDIYDTGKTFQYFIDNFKVKNLVMGCLISKSFYLAHVIDKNRTARYNICYGDYVEPDKFVVFPWEENFLEGLRNLEQYHY